MKKLIFVLLSSISISLLAACSNTSKTKISFGSYIDEDIQELSYQELIIKVKNKENMIVSSYYDYVASCQCQFIFNDLLKEYVKNHDYVIYSFNNKDISEKKDKYGFQNFGMSNPALYIVENGKVKNSFLYTQKAYEDIFTNKSKFEALIDKYCDKPDYIYVDKEYLDSNLPNEKQSSVCFLRSGCMDCQYLLPNFIIPFGKTHSLKTILYLFDIQKYYNTDAYISLKSNYYLTEESNAKFGYGDGVVPTIQYLEKGKIVSAVVYLNDSISYDLSTDSYKITNTYYTKDRIKDLPFLDESDALEGLTIKKDEVSSSIWLNKYASKYHDALLTKFFEYYLL